MDNQHEKIKGYRSLTQVEIDLMNKIKEKGAELGALLNEVHLYLAKQNEDARGLDELNRLKESEPLRWRAMAKSHFQEGLMALTRSVAQPTFF